MAETDRDGGFALRTVERFLNTLIEGSTAAGEQVAALEGKSLGLSIVGPEIEIVVRSDGRALALERAPAASSSAVLIGTPVALLQVARRPAAGDLGGSGVSVKGDARVLEDFRRLYALAAPDLEEELARVCGDVVAHGAFRAARSVRGWASRALEALALNAAEYLQEESRDLPARAEAEGFYRDVEALRDDVERAAARAEGLARDRRAPRAKPGPAGSAVPGDD